MYFENVLKVKTNIKIEIKINILHAVFLTLWTNHNSGWNIADVNLFNHHTHNKKKERKEKEHKVFPPDPTLGKKKKNHLFSKKFYQFTNNTCEPF